MYVQGESSLQEAFLLFDVAFQHCGKAVMQRHLKVLKQHGHFSRLDYICVWPQHHE